ncbi:hypothetical protein Tco_1222031 [Tanacetum coccineum]
MSTQQDIYAAGSENCPPMLNKDNYVPWSSRLLPYAKSKPNGKLLVNSINNGPYTDDELTDQEKKQMEVDDQAIQTILMGLPEDIYAAVDSCQTAKEIWLRVEQMMKGSTIGAREKKAKLEKHFPEQIASNFKFLNNLQPEWNRSVTIVHQTKNLYEVDYTQLYDFLKFNQAENIRNQNGLIVFLGIAPLIANQYANQNGNSNVLAAQAKVMQRRRDAAYLQTQFLIAQKEEAWIQLQTEEFDLMVAVRDIDEIEDVNTNCVLMDNLQQEFNIGNNNNVIHDASSMEQSRGTVDQNPATAKEIRAHFESLYNNLAIKVERFNMVNRKIRETNADLTTELARYKSQEKCFEINQEKYDILERGYQKSVYQEQCLTKKINDLHLSSAKQITTLNGEIANLNNQPSKEKSIVSNLQKENKQLKSDFKIREDELLDKNIDLEKKIKELDNILVK